MSLWTPGGERPVDRPEDPADGGMEPRQLSPEDQADMEAMAAEMAEVRQQLLSVPAALVVANHAMGLYELAAIHLGNQPPNLGEARIAIDAFAALLASVEGKLGPDEETLHDALGQIRLAFVQLSGAGAPAATGPEAAEPEPADSPAADS